MHGDISWFSLLCFAGSMTWAIMAQGHTEGVDGIVGLRISRALFRMEVQLSENIF